MSTSPEDREAFNKFVSDVKIALDDKPAKKPASDPSFAGWNGIIEDREKRYFDDPTWPAWLINLIGYLANKTEIPRWGVALAIISMIANIALVICVIAFS